MDHTFWHKQTDKPLFPELEWNKPERRDQAGRLLIIGGYLHNLNAPAKAYQYAIEQGIGSAKVALPNKTKILLGKSLPSAVFLPNTPSGELARDGFEELINYANWADTILLAGDLGKNSQTTLVVGDLIQNVSNQMILTKDAIDILQNSPEIMVNRENTTMVLSFAQLQKLAQNLNSTTPLIFTMDLIKLLDFLHDFTNQYSCDIITLHQNKLLVASSGKISTTPISEDQEKSWRTKTATIASCYQTWSPEKTFESLSYSVWVATKND